MWSRHCVMYWLKLWCLSHGCSCHAKAEKFLLWLWWLWDNYDHSNYYSYDSHDPTVPAVTVSLRWLPWLNSNSSCRSRSRLDPTPVVTLLPWSSWSSCCDKLDKFLMQLCSLGGKQSFSKVLFSTELKKKCLKEWNRLSLWMHWCHINFLYILQYTKWIFSCKITEQVKITTKTNMIN